MLNRFTSQVELFALLVVWIGLGGARAHGATLSLSSGSGAPGTIVTLDLSLNTVTGMHPAAVEWIFTYSSSDFTSATVATGPAAAAANKSVSCSYRVGAVTCVAWGLNSTPISDGVVATIAFALSASTPNNSSSIQFSYGLAAAPDSTAIPATTSGGSVTILQASAVSVSINPPSVTIQNGGQSQQFTATVSNASNTAVTWSLTPMVGTLSSSGLYTAPPTINSVQTVTVTATSVADPTKSASVNLLLSPLGSGLLFVPITPCRAVDTRSFAGKTGPFGPPFLSGGTSRSFPLPSSPCGVPASAVAYSLNITALPHQGLLYLTAWPSGAPLPRASTLNSWDGRWAANAAIIPAGTAGAVSIFASDDTEVLVDINGYFDLPSNPQGQAFYPVTPCRVADTRSGQSMTGPFGPPFVAAGSPRVIPILSSTCGGISPSSQAYSLNITAFPRTGAMQFLSAWPAGQPFPVVSTLNSVTGIVVANAALVPAGTSGGITLYVSDDADVIIDINGYFAPPSNPGALSFYAQNPCRVADTRSDQGKTGPFGPPALAAGSTRTVPIPASSCSVPNSAQAYSLNITALPPAPLGWVTVWPAGLGQPRVSTLNAYTGTATANAALVPAGTGGAIDIFASDTTNIIVDINGFYAP